VGSLLAVLVACEPPQHIDPPGPDTGGEDTGDEIELVDDDGDGFPTWSEDPSQVDCDDSDPEVTPATERFVPEGWFLRGDPDVETPDGDITVDTERPPSREVWVSDFCVDVYEVTNQDFLALLQWSLEQGHPNETPEGDSLFDFEDDDDVFPERLLDEGGAFSIEEGYALHPVAEVWHHSAEFYCAWVGKSLPSEAQWEKAARGEDTRRHPWGDAEATCELSNTSMNFNEMCVGDTVDVGSYPGGVSPYGAHDLIGNMGEWVADWYSTDFYLDGPDEDPLATQDDAELIDFPESSDYARIARGGSFALGAPLDTVHARFVEPEMATSNGLGFRCVRQAP